MSVFFFKRTNKGQFKNTMLNKKTIYAIYLLHKVSGLCADNSLSDIGEKRFSYSMKKLRLENYLTSQGQIRHNLDKISLLNLLLEMRWVVDHLSLTKEEKAEFPRNLHQFDCNYKKWLENIQST